MVLPVPVREDESLSLQVLGASSLALWMRDLDSDQGSEADLIPLVPGLFGESLAITGRILCPTSGC